MSDAGLQLFVNGDIYGGWESMRITRGLEQLAGMFELTVSEKWAGQDVARPIAAGSACIIKLDGDEVITGFIDEVDSDGDSENHTLTFRGRDATGDLVDCIAVTPLQLAGLKLDQIAKKLCKPFGIKVVVDADVGDAWPLINIVCGQKIFELLDQIARARGVLLTSDGLGNLVITEPGTTVAPVKIELGRNALRSHGHTDLKGRFSEYHIYDQLTGSGSSTYDDSHTQIEAIAYDPVMKALRYRPSGQQGDLTLNQRFAKQRANWMRNTAAARSQRATHAVNGWKHSAGLWKPNTLVSVTDKWLQLDNQQRLISEVVYSLAAKGKTAEISTVTKGAYDRLVEPNSLLLMENGL